MGGLRFTHCEVLALHVKVETWKNLEQQIIGDPGGGSGRPVPSLSRHFDTSASKRPFSDRDVLNFGARKCRFVVFYPEKIVQMTVHVSKHTILAVASSEITTVRTRGCAIFH